MKLYYSATTNGFYCTDIHTEEQIPAGAVEISPSEHNDLFRAQGEGKVIQPDPSGNGRPCARVKVLTTEEKAEIVRSERARLLLVLDQTVGNPLRWAGFTDAQKNALATYRQELLDVPQQIGFPNTVTWPEMPNV
jgi:hypothetical protein